MVRNSETSYDARLGQGRTMQSVIAGLSGYAANEAVLSPSGFGIFLDELQVLNDELSGLENRYFDQAAQRRAFYKEGEESLIKRLRLIKTAVEVSSGRDSSNAEQVASLIKTMRGAKPVEYIKKAKEPSGEDKLVKMSQSQTSYDSLAGTFGEIVSKVSNMQNYFSPNAGLTVSGLQALLATALQHNLDTNALMIAYKKKQQERQDKYEELARYGGQIKGLVMLVAGVDSAEYKIVKKLNP